MPCPYQKLDSAISVVQATQNVDCLDDPVALHPSGQGGILAQREMSPGSVVIVDIALHDPAKLLFAGDNDVVETFSPDRTDHPFGITVLPGRSSSNRPVSNAHGTQSIFKGLAVDAVPIPEQMPRTLIPRECLRDLAAKPRCGWMIVMPKESSCRGSWPS